MVCSDWINLLVILRPSPFHLSKRTEAPLHMMVWPPLSSHSNDDYTSRKESFCYLTSYGGPLSSLLLKVLKITPTASKQKAYIYVIRSRACSRHALRWPQGCPLLLFIPASKESLQRDVWTYAIDLHHLGKMLCRAPFLLRKWALLLFNFPILLISTSSPQKASRKKRRTRALGLVYIWFLCTGIGFGRCME